MTMKTAKQKAEEFYPYVDEEKNFKYNDNFTINDIREEQRYAFIEGYNAAREKNNPTLNNCAFEYCIVKYDITDYDTEARMNRMGAKGWEIIKITDSIGTQYFRVYYKRIK